MRTIRMAVIALIAAAVGFNPVMGAPTEEAEEREETREFHLGDAPQAVQDAIREAVGSHEIAEVERETEDGPTLYEAEWYVGEHKQSLKLTEEGVVVEREAGMSAADLPQAVRDGIASAYPGAEIRSGERAETTEFAVRISQEGRNREVRLTPWGAPSRGGGDDDDAVAAPAPASAAPSAPLTQFSTTFTNPDRITNRYFPLSELERVVLEGEEDGDKVRVVRTRVETSREFTFEGQTIRPVAIEDRETVNGEIEEITIDYFAQADDGTVYYLGEDVDEYHHGRVVGHGGAWLLGQETATPGVLMPGTPEVGQRFRPEDVPGITIEEDEVVAIDDTVETPAGTFEHCVQIEEHSGSEAAEHKWYAPGIGNVSENGELLLTEYR